MELLDTNILSALMQPHLPDAVERWKRERDPRQVIVTAAPCAAEIWAGVRALAAGRRRQALEQAARALFTVDLAGRVLPFDPPAAEAYGELRAACRRNGRPRPTVDLMIAAIARVHGATVVTRNADDFAGCGVAVVNPWAAGRA